MERRIKKNTKHETIQICNAVECEQPLNLD